MISSNTYIKHEKKLYSIATGLSASLAVYIVLLLHLDAPYWSAISVVAICAPGVTITLNKGLLRIIGTIAGAALGLFIASITVNDFYAFIIWSFFIYTISQYLTYYTNYKYALILGAATYFMVSASIINDIDNIYYIAFWRSTEVCTGVIVASIVILIMFSKSARQTIESDKISPSQEKLSISNSQKIFRSEKNLSIMKESIKNGLGVILALFIWMFTASPGGLQGIISALAVAQPKSEEHNISTVLHNAKNRFLGCFLGGATGLLCLYKLQLNIIFLLIVLFIGSSIFSYITLTSKKYSYLGIQANVAFIITLIQNDIVTTSIVPAMMRLSGIFIGIFSLVLVHLLIWPKYK
ncbi:FUSC family protein [Thiotrichales bacterium 19S9-12]|nr:FUSC family protein [Thiotrichales bacterium 19S9-11]MCF6811037.1 FUSC family protein [Thiotrichales bacterium 19S9-12]